ncbi:LysR family transcriptional regulator [Marinobacter profundi]|uniref:LysR family transcriptional regulator n=1 Tax=Marinobacter profundi TaxID=2666256 RepID=A0A2G1UQV5_9GAMM|nr:LysR family transcriptional regulator [Marinobacter profundi]PHQ16887.1 LysR family transcriptional regulator [Marinobacter profundi]
MNEQLIRWDDLQIVWAISQTGTLSGAGRRLKISHATVFRRLANIERRLGVALFERSRTGYIPTPAGEDLVVVAQRVEADIKGAERRLAGQDLRLSGNIRVTTTDTLYARLLAPAFAEFRMHYPDIELEIVISNQVHSLSKREADVAIRPTRNPPETLIGRRVGTIDQAIYGQKSHWQDVPTPLNALSDYGWIGPDKHMGDIALETWMTERGLDDHCHYRVDSMLGMQMAVRNGSELAVLPCYVGDMDVRLRRLSNPLPELATPLWLLIHPDLRRVSRIRAFSQTMADHIRYTLHGQV